MPVPKPFVPPSALTSGQGCCSSVPAQAKAVVTDEEVHHQSVAREARELPHGKEPNVEKENAEEKDNAEEKEKEKKLMETEKQNDSLSFSFSSPSSKATFPLVWASWRARSSSCTSSFWACIS